MQGIELYPLPGSPSSPGHTGPARLKAVFATSDGIMPLVLVRGVAPLVTGIAGRRGDPCSRERRPKSRNGNAQGRLPERRRNSTSLPAGTRPRHHANSTAPPWELDRAASGRTRSRAERLLHRGKVREAKRKRSAAPINQHREGGRSRASAGTLSLVPSRPSFLLVVSGTSPQINLDHGSC